MVVSVFGLCLGWLEVLICECGIEMNCVQMRGEE